VSLTEYKLLFSQGKTFSVPSHHDRDLVGMLLSCNDLVRLRLVASNTNSYVEHICNSGTTLWNSGKEGKEKRKS
jgi:hypothetical protein